MRLASVRQLQTLNRMMNGQLDAHTVPSVMILGIAGGNGLQHVQKYKFQKIYGVDVNAHYLREVSRSYPDLDGLLECLHVDLLKEYSRLPHADLVIADLICEYIGCECFKKVIQQVQPSYISCIFQCNVQNQWVSHSPYAHVFTGLEKSITRMMHRHWKNRSSGLGIS